MSENFKNYLNEVRRDHMVRYYEDHSAYFYGKISATAGALVTYFLEGHFIFLSATIGMLAIMLADVGNIRQYQQIVSISNKKFSSWEYHYTFLSTTFMLMLGIWTFFCFSLTSDPFIHMLCVAISLGNVLSVIVRNFSNDKVLTMQLAAVAVPLLIGILHYGDFRAMILCAFFLPLFSSIRDVSARLRDLFSSAQQQSDEKEAFSLQLNTALESMSHGLMMFDENMRIKIINKTARAILGIHQDTNCYDHTLEDVSQFIDLEPATTNKVRTMATALFDRLKCRSTDKIFKLGPNQYVEISLEIRNDGGCVMVIEEVSERIRYQTKINQLARFDELTGLYNRSFFLQQAKQALSGRNEASKAAILFFDLDDFKRINDTLGHEAGDFILTSVAERLNRILPKSAFAGRYGGDEFVVFVNTEELPNGVEALAQSIVRTIPRGLEFSNQQLRFGVSVGVASYPQDGHSIDRLLKLADLALYEAKGDGKNQFRSFTLDMEESLQKRVVLEEALTEAVQKQALELHFQPIVSIGNGQTKVFEALTRWNWEGHGPVSPAEFIPIAEDLGLIREIGVWTLFEACRQCCRWPEGTSVAVNLSAVQLQVGSVVDSVKAALESTGLPPHRLEVEITETAVLNDIGYACSVLEEISALGVRISLDDFGTGYSSLSYLHKLPLDKLKIDKSFVDNVVESQRSRTLLKGITVLGKALDLKIVVEGIETQEQFDLLHNKYNIDFVQGYLFSRALPAEDALEFVRLSVGESQRAAMKQEIPQEIRNAVA